MRREQGLDEESNVREAKLDERVKRSTARELPRLPVALSTAPSVHDHPPSSVTADSDATKSIKSTLAALTSWKPVLDLSTFSTPLQTERTEPTMRTEHTEHSRTAKMSAPASILKDKGSFLGRALPYTALPSTPLPLTAPVAVPTTSPQNADDRIPFISQRRLRQRISQEGRSDGDQESALPRTLSRAVDLPDKPRPFELPRAQPPPMSSKYEKSTSAGGMSATSAATSFALPNEFVLVKTRSERSDVSSDAHEDVHEDERDRSREPSPERPRGTEWMDSSLDRGRSRTRTISRESRPSPERRDGSPYSGGSESNGLVSERIQNFIETLREHSTHREDLIQKEYKTRVEDRESMFGEFVTPFRQSFSVF